MKNNKPRIKNIFQMIWQNFIYILTPPSLSSLQTFKAKGKPRSLYLRHLDCGSCNGCELELNALSNPIYDIEQYGIRFESSPRHADAIIMTGAYTRNLEQAAHATLNAMPSKRIITVGDCTQGGGMFNGSYATIDIPPEIEDAVEVHVPGCPPTPEILLSTLLQLPEK